MSNEAIQAQIEALARDIRAGETVKTSTGATGTASTILYADSSSQLAQGGAVTASKPVYVDSSSVPQGGDFPFAVPVSGLTSTTATFLALTGQSTLSGTNDLGSNLVVASAVTTFTETAYIRVTLTDDGGNVTDGDHYIAVGTLA